MNGARRALRRARRVAVALALAGLALPAASQLATPDVPAGDATLHGTVVHGARAEPLSGVEVVLYALPQNGAPGVRRTVSDASGRFRFENVSGDPGTPYLVGARYREVPFPGARVRFEAGEREREVEVVVSEVATGGEVEVEALEARLEWQGGQVALLESWVLRNPGERTLFVPPAERERVAAPLTIPLPEGAGAIDVPLGLRPEGLVQRGETLHYYGPIYPGPQQLDFLYSIRVSPGAAPLSRPLPLGAARVELLAPRDGPAFEVAALTEAAAAEGDDPRLVKLVGEDFAPGSALELVLEVPPARVDPNAISIAEVEVVLELDVAALQVRERHVVAVAGDAWVMPPPGDVLLRMPLPAGAEAVRGGAETPGVRLAQDQPGELALLGPLPPGESVLRIEYRLPAEGVTRLARRFGAPVSLLDVFLADDGRLRVESDRLHRRRPIRSADRFFAHYQGFQIARDEPIELALQPIATDAGMPRALRTALLLTIALASGALLLAPLRERETAPAPEAVSRSSEEREREREAVYSALRDLEHDRETGKLDADDHARMRDALRTRALSLLRAEREATHDVPPEAPAGEADGGPGAACPACEAEARPGDRFCARCGQALTPPAESGARA